MGCDIHVHIELRYEGKWEHYSAVRVDRWYELFDRMAGVRGNGPAIVEPKGIPVDMSVITALDWERGRSDWHTASWFNEDEIDELSLWLRAVTDDFCIETAIFNGVFMFGNGLTDHKHYDDSEYLPKGADAVRVVFWFDN